MTVTAYVPLLVCIVGLLMYWFGGARAGGKLAVVGLEMFKFGLLVSLAVFAHATVRL